MAPTLQAQVSRVTVEIIQDPDFNARSSTPTQCFWLRRGKRRPWSEQNSDQNSDHPRLCIYQGKEKLRPWLKFLRRENSDHGLSLGCFWGRGRRGGSHDSTPAADSGNQKNPRAHKNRIGTSIPPSRKPQPPPPRTRNFTGMGIFQQKEPKKPGAHKIGAAISGLSITGGKIMDTKLFLRKGKRHTKT